MAEFLNGYLFHWTPEKAIWIAGHTLLWDARCAGIYIGVGVGVLYQLLARRGVASLPSVRGLVMNALLTVPLFVDVLTVALGVRLASNESRYLTGLLFGTALSVCILPACVVLFRSRPDAPPASGALGSLAPLVALAVGAFALKGWDSVIAFAVLHALSVFGSLGLLGMLSLGTLRAARTGVLTGRVVRSLALIATTALVAGCAAPVRSVRSGACEPATFVASRNGDGSCMKETCKDGQVALVEDPTPTAPVDDWAEEKFCLRHPIKCRQAYRIKQQVERWQKGVTGTDWWGESVHNGIGDAVRHAHVMCLVAERFGADFARGLGIAHEEDSEFVIFSRKAAPGNRCCEKVMDLRNNEVGIMLAGRPGSCEEKVLGSVHLLRHSQCPRQEKRREEP